MDELTAAEIAGRYGVSLRTARRHKAAGTLPDATRKVGQDGKSYAGSVEAYAPRRRRRTPLTGDLDMARNALRRLGRSPTFSGDDLQRLRDVVRSALEVSGKWRDGRACRVEQD